MRLLEAATWIYKSQKKKQPFCLRALLLERKELHAAKRNNDDFSAKIMMSDSLQSPSLIQEPLSRPTASTISVPGRPAKPSAEANMLKWCACWTCKYDSWHPWRGMPTKKKKFSPLAESLTGEMLEMDESVCKTGFAQICLCERPTVSYECKNNISTLTDSTKQLLNIEVLSDR